MGWIDVKKKKPKVGEIVSIYGILHAYRENYSKGELKKSVQHDVTYYGKKEDGKYWFGGWSSENEGVTHWTSCRPLPSA
jgi:hypothetical protein